MTAQVRPGVAAARVLAEQRQPGALGEQREAGGAAAEEAGGDQDGEAVLVAHQLQSGDPVARVLWERAWTRVRPLSP